MVKEYLMLLCAAVLLAVFFVFNKFWQKRMGNTLVAGLAFNVILGALAAVMFFFIGGAVPQFTLFSALLAALMSVFVIAYTLLGFKIMDGGSMAMYSLFLMSGGMIVPYVFGLIYLDEDFSVLRTVGVAIITFAIVLSNLKGKGERANVFQLILCVSVFLLNGCVSVISKIHQVTKVYETVGTEQFVALAGVFKVIVAGGIMAALLCAKSKKTETAKCEIKKSLSSRKAVVISIAVIVFAAISDGVSYFLQLLSASKLPATVQYPIMTGGSMLLTSLAGVVVFRDRLSPKMIVSLALAFVGTLCFL